jgi:hypothetical protein
MHLLGNFAEFKIIPSLTQKKQHCFKTKYTFFLTKPQQKVNKAVPMQAMQVCILGNGSIAL